MYIFSGTLLLNAYQHDSKARQGGPDSKESIGKGGAGEMAQQIKVLNCLAKHPRAMRPNIIR